MNAPDELPSVSAYREQRRAIVAYWTKRAVDLLAATPNRLAADDITARLKCPLKPAAIAQGLRRHPDIRSVVEGNGRRRRYYSTRWLPTATRPDRNPGGASA